jgi:guanyl-specific ribonuclease Sa
MQIRTTPALVTAVLAAAIAVAGCSAAHPTTSASTAPAQSTSTAPAQSASTAPAQSASTAPAQSSTSFTMPNEIGHVLQDAQDDLQRVSGNSVYYSRSHDLLGNRHQILDRDWRVCTQNIAKGAIVSESDTVDFGVVKLSESCP